MAVQYGFGSYKGVYSPDGVCPTIVSLSRGQPSQIVKVLIYDEEMWKGNYDKMYSCNHVR